MANHGIPAEYRRAEWIFTQYRETVEMVAQLEEDYALAAPINDNTPVQSAPGDTTGRQGLRMAQDRQLEFYRLCVKACDKAIQRQKQKPNGEVIMFMICAVYWQNTRLPEAAEKVGYCYEQARRLRHEFITDVMRGMGWDEGGGNNE